MFQSRSHTLLTHERTALQSIRFCPGRSVRHARYRYGGTYIERRLDNIPRLMRKVKFICPGIKRSNKARIGLKGLQ